MKPMEKRSWNDYSPCEICLINPPWITLEDNIWHAIKPSMPPLSLLSLASFLEKKGRNVAIIDIHAENLSISALKKRIVDLRPKIVGITVMTSTAVQSNLIACLAKEVDPGVVVVMGGVHAGVLPEECLANRAVDIVVRGDGEFTFDKLCEALLNNNSFASIHGISFHNGTGVIHSPSAPFIPDINVLPMPSYHLVPMHMYHPAVGAYRRLPAINMVMTRGCPGRCSFCNSAQTPLRTRAAELIVEEIEYLKERYGIREIQFYDDTFTISRANVLKFCALLKKRRLGISWSAFSRVDCINEEIIHEMKAAGCHQMMFGVESGDPGVLEKMGKPINLEKTESAIKASRKAGIQVRCAFIYGCEGRRLIL